MTSSKHRRSRSHEESESIPARHLRVQSLLFQEVSRLFRGELSDPLLEGVAVTSLELTPDGRNARLGFTLPPELANLGPGPVEEALKRANGFIRSQLALGLDMKRVPHLRFVYVGVATQSSWDEESEEGGEA